MFIPWKELLHRGAWLKVNPRMWFHTQRLSFLLSKIRTGFLIPHLSSRQSFQPKIERNQFFIPHNTTFFDAYRRMAYSMNWMYFELPGFPKTNELHLTTLTMSPCNFSTFPISFFSDDEKKKKSRSSRCCNCCGVQWRKEEDGGWLDEGTAGQKTVKVKTSLPSAQSTACLRRGWVKGESVWR